MRDATEPTIDVAIFGGGGMLGQKLAAELLAQGLGGRRVAHLLSVDRSAPADGGFAPRMECRAFDIVRDDPTALFQEWRPDVVFHLAAVVSGEAEADFDLGYAVNVEGTRRLLEAFRHLDWAPRLVFASSLAVYGGALPPVVPDDFAPAPQSSYGAQKAIGELYVGDYARKGFVDGISVRLPTVIVRPGAPNRAASGFLSSIVREPLAGQSAVLPVPGDTGVWVASPETAVGTLLHAAALPRTDIGEGRILVGRGITTTPDAILAALARLAGADVAARVVRADDPRVAAIVASWPRAFACERAARLGFPVDIGIEAIIAAYIDRLHT